MEKIQGYKTFIVAGLLIVYAVLNWMSIEVPDPDGETALSVGGAFMILMRLVTKTPPGGTGKS